MGYIQCKPLSQRTKREEVEEEGGEKRWRESREGGEDTELALSFSGKALSLEPQTPWQNRFSGIPRGGWVEASSLFLTQRFGLELCEFTPGLQRQAAGILEQDPRGHDLSVMSLSKLHLWATCTDKPG